MALQPQHCLETPSQGGAKTASAPADATERRLERPIVCRTCQTRVSHMDALFLMDADRVHRVFANPAGLLMEIVTARAAQNLHVVGPPTTEFTWYRGYAWEVAYCASCQSHLGWAFGATEGERAPASFFGLLKGSIVLG